MNELIDKDYERIAGLFGRMAAMLKKLESLHEQHRPLLRGERYLTDRDEILLYLRKGAAQGSRNIADYCKIHLDTGVALSGVLGCFAVNNCQSFYVSEQ